MKELSIEQKARRYDEALAWMRDLYPTMDGAMKEDAEHYFPELVESEDEKVRKWIKNELESKYVVDNIVNNVMADKALDWLEKQGKDDMGISESTKQELEDNLNKALEKETAESYNEFLDGQESADKTEPKFKVGDWIVSNVSHEDYRICKILNIENGEYAIESIYGYQGHNSFETFDKDYHLWTIQDAKDGDVLCCESGWTCIFKKLVNDETFSSYCFMDNTKWFCETGSVCHTLKEEFVKAYNGKIYPATKEQRDKLEKAMFDAGYKWNKEELKLEKI